MTCSRTHSLPDPKVLWSQWACASCTPELYDDMTIQGPESDGKRQCPMCLNTAIYRDGRFRKHFDDGPNDRCRGSELCFDMVMALLGAMYRNLSIEAMLSEFIVRPGKRRESSSPQSKAEFTASLKSVVDELVWTRQSVGVPAVRIASVLGVTKPAFSRWETKVSSCYIGNLCRWAEFLGYRVILTSDDGEVRSDFFTHLKRSRQQRCLTFDEVETDTGLARSSLSCWERQEREPCSNDFSILAAYLGYQLAIIPKERNEDRVSVLAA